MSRLRSSGTAEVIPPVVHEFSGGSTAPEASSGGQVERIFVLSGESSVSDKVQEVEL